MNRAAKQIQNESNIKALKRARVLKGQTRQQLAEQLGVSYKSIEKYENGRTQISEGRLLKILNALNISIERFNKIKKGKTLNTRKERTKKVLSNQDRRSYQKIISKECKVLKSMRRMKKISQDQASKICGYSRPTIGHIENGRIELSNIRVKHIIESYGYKYSDFEENIDKEELRDNIIDSCIEKIDKLDDQKLDLLKKLLRNF